MWILETGEVYMLAYRPRAAGDAGPIRLMTIAHAFNYRMAVLRNGVKSAVRVA